MCTYNGARFLQPQLDSIAAQTRLPDELIVWDDESEDESRQIIESFATAAPFPVKLHRNKNNLGSTKTFENAVGVCEGDIIALCDQDDAWMPNKLEEMERTFSASARVGLVFSDAELVDKDLEPLGLNLKEFTLTASGVDSVNEGRILDLMLDRNVVTGATMAFRSRFRKVLPTPEGIHLIHDGWIALMIALLDDVAYIDKPLIKYRQHPNQQLGVRNLIREDLSRAEVFAGRASYCWHILPGLKAAYERLQNMTDEPGAKRAMEVVQQKIEHLGSLASHLQARADAGFQPKRLKRLPAVLKELRSSRYSLHSRGIFSAAKDLLN